MSFHFRKSVKIGPFRLNFSKSGIGVSAGVPGARISTGPRGTYIHMGRNGFYYRKKLDESTPKTQEHSYENSSSNNNEAPIDENHELKELAPNEFIDQINNSINQPKYALLIAAISIIFFCIFLVAGSSIQNTLIRSAIFVISFALLILGIYFGWVTDRQENIMQTTTLEYNLEGLAESKFNELVDALGNIALSNRIWQVTAKNSNWDWKHNAGASSLITRKTTSIRAKEPLYLQTKLKVYCLSLGHMDLFFLPDQIFAYQNRKYRSIPYNSLQVTMYPSRYIESEGVPGDSNIADYTWQYVRVDGGPDRRFANNRQLPIVNYGNIEISSPSGVNLHLQVSNLLFAQQLAQTLSGYIEFIINPKRETSNKTSSGQENQSRKKTGRNAQNSSAYATLNVNLDASKDEVTSAYKKLAHQYHPDKVEGLGPEFKELAEKRMREINAAYKELMSKFKDSEN